MSRRVVAVLGRGVVPADTPILRADDLGAVRGDGIFETMRVWDGRPWLLAEHLARLVSSAARLDLAVPPGPALEDLVARACAAWPRDAEGALRLVCTRGPEEGGEVTTFATVTPIAARILVARAEGVRVLTATLGMAATARPDAPWLLGGAKTVSYAVNMASLRWAAAQGADDVLWTSTDGYALEAPTATLVWLGGDVLCTVPPGRTGVLPGTTARYLLDRAAELGLGADERMVRPADLSTMDGVWLASSVRGVVEVRAIDGAPAPVPSQTAAIRKLLGFEPGLS
jgi:4-amino-4-deoxychorismate lyase